MYTKTAFLRVAPLLGAAVACALFAGNVVAKDKNVTVVIHVSHQGLDLRQPADAHKFYMRLQNAAWVACTRGDQVALAPVDDLQGCIEEALGGAIRSAKIPLLTRIYLETHTLQAAAAHGIDVPAQVAAK